MICLRSLLRMLLFKICCGWFVACDLIVRGSLQHWLCALLVVCFWLFNCGFVYFNDFTVWVFCL